MIEHSAHSCKHLFGARQRLGRALALADAPVEIAAGDLLVLLRSALKGIG